MMCDIQADTDALDNFLTILEGVPVISVHGFMSVNSQDGVSLAGMSLTGDEALASLGSSFKVGKTSFNLRCGPQGGSNQEDFCGLKTLLTVKCERVNGSQCVEWKASLLGVGGLDSGTFITGDSVNVAFRCRLFELSRGNQYLIGDFDMPVGLRFFRDADEKGDPDDPAELP